jgi:prolyl-tRNA editing enzyme YbaK/EbsC (Cys-tRNA(Pro) deacylase)
MRGSQAIATTQMCVSTPPAPPAACAGRAWQGGAVTLPQLAGLESLSVDGHQDLLAPSVAAALADWPHTGDVAVVEIDPAVADTAAMNAAYGLPDTAGANCVVVAGKRDGEERVAACLVRADTRADVNNTVKRTLDVRKASFLALDRAVEESGMEYGGITPVGLPDGWRVLVDPRVLGIEVAVIGSGVRRSKLLVPGHLLGRLPSAEVVEGLAGTAPA